ncbi:MAG: cobalamin biosynthesis protein CbiA [Desulfobacterales bacterium]|nr:cobalamin biosynthesis protein CbiA [Desulfobacterales bacterium]
MKIELNGVVIIVGNYGSGKTEVAINLAVYHKRAGVDVRIADLDVVNPYFRTREAIEALSNMGIDVVLPPEQYLQADLPILSPEVAGRIRQPGQLMLLDVGGDDVGATILASLENEFRGKSPRVLQVINPLRPFTETHEGCLKIRDAIETASKLTVNGLIGNANLIDDTAPDDIYDGYHFVNDLSKRSGLPLELITVNRALWASIDMHQFTCPVLPIDRQLVPPWQKPVEFGQPEAPG